MALANNEPPIASPGWLTVAASFILGLLAAASKWASLKRQRQTENEKKYVDAESIYVGGTKDLLDRYVSEITTLRNEVAELRAENGKLRALVDELRTRAALADKLHEEVKILSERVESFEKMANGNGKDKH